MNELIVPTRRKFLTTLAGLVAAPAVVKFDSLMGVRPIKLVKIWQYSFTPDELSHATCTRDGMIEIGHRIITPEALANYLNHPVEATIIEKKIYTPTSFVADVEATDLMADKWTAKSDIDWTYQSLENEQRVIEKMNCKSVDAPAFFGETLDADV